MISHERSDLPRFKVAVPVDDYRFPESCILCGKLESVKIGATFMKVWILGSIGLWREQVVAISVCETHAEEYYRREKSRSNLMAMFFLIGILMLFLAPVLFPEIPASHSHRAETPLGPDTYGLYEYCIYCFCIRANARKVAKPSDQDEILHVLEKRISHIYFPRPSHHGSILDGQSGKEPGKVASPDLGVCWSALQTYLGFSLSLIE